jgi:hypothetical protein
MIAWETIPISSFIRMNSHDIYFSKAMLGLGMYERPNHLVSSGQASGSKYAGITVSGKHSYSERIAMRIETGMARYSGTSFTRLSISFLKHWEHNNLLLNSAKSPNSPFPQSPHTLFWSSCNVLMTELYLWINEIWCAIN